MKVFRVLALLAIEDKAESSAIPPAMDRRVLSEGFFCCKVCVKTENWAVFELDMMSWKVLGSTNAWAHKRWV